MAGNELTVQTTLPSIGKLQRSMANEQSMMAKAARLVPNTNTFLKSIMDRNIHSADVERSADAMQTLATDYLGNYAKDPFYAFTQRGRLQTTQMQGIVNNPMFTQMEEAKKHNDKEIGRMQTDQLLTEMVIDDFGRLAVRDAKGNRSFKYASEIDREAGEFAVNINQDHAMLDRLEGGRRRAAYDMQSMETTRKQIQTTAAALGGVKYTRELDEIRNSFAGVETSPYGVTNVESRSDNIGAIEAEIERMRAGGLSPTAMKSLYSAYYRNNPQEFGAEGAEDRAKRWAFDQITAIAKGQRNVVNSLTTEKAIGGIGGSGGAGTPQEILPFDVMAFRGTGTAKQNTIDLEGNLVSYNAPVAHVSLQHDVSKTIKTRSGKIRPDRSRDTDKFLQVGDIKKLQIMNNDTGKYEVIPYEMLANSITSTNPKATRFVYMPSDISGNIINNEKFKQLQKDLNNNKLSDTDRKLYIFKNNGKDEIRLSPGFISTKWFADEKGFLGIDLDDRGASDWLELRGHTSKRDNVNDYNDYSGENVLDSNIVSWFADGVYSADIFIPLNEQYLGAGINYLSEAKVLTDRYLNMSQNQGINMSVGRGTPANSNFPANSHDDYRSLNSK